MKCFVPFLALLAGCAMSPEQMQSLGPGNKVVCFHARCEDSVMCGGKWSTTTMGAGTDNAQTISERCEVGKK